MNLKFVFLFASGVLLNIVVSNEIKDAPSELPLPEKAVENSSPVPAPVAATPDEQSISTGNKVNSFVSKVNKYVFSSNEKENPESMIWSPLSVYSLLIPLYYGADGTTLEELKKCLNIQNDNDLLVNLTQVSSKSALSSFTGLFVSQSVTMSPSYTDKVFNSPSNKNSGMTTKVEPVNFKQSLSKSVNQINSIISNATGGLIEKIVDASSVSPDTVMVIVNAVQFKGKWKSPFDAKMTKIDPFNGLKEIANVEMMNQKGTFDFAEFKEFNASVLQLEYAESPLVSQFILPDKGTSIQSVWKTISENGVLNYISQRFEPKEMEIFIPKFRKESDVPVQDALTKLGLENLFAPTANLSRMILPSKENRNDVYVSKLVHKTVVETDEKGTEAAGSTAAVLIPLSGFISQTEVFRADRPFIIIIKDGKTDTVAFMGAITEMASEGKRLAGTSERVNLINAPEKGQSEDVGNEDSKVTEGKTVTEQLSATTSNADEEWWKYSGAPEYLNPDNFPTPENASSFRPVTPRFQQPEPNNPSGIRFPYPLRSEFRKVNSTDLNSKKSKEKVKS